MSEELERLRAIIREQAHHIAQVEADRDRAIKRLHQVGERWSDAKAVNETEAPAVSGVAPR